MVFCDLQMPDLDGVEFVRQLVQIGFRGGFVLVSGEDMRIIAPAEKLAANHNLTVLGGIRKPASQVTLETIMQRVEANLCHQEAVTSLQETAPLPVKLHGADELQRALFQGELVNYYQPKFSFRDPRLIGVETLVSSSPSARWAGIP